MPLYWMVGFNMREGRSSQYKKFLASNEFKQICKKIREQTGIKYLETYYAVIPSSSEEGDYDAYEMWEVPNRAALDRMRESSAFGKLMEKTYGMTEPRPVMSRMLRTAKDVTIMYEPRPKK